MNRWSTKTFRAVRDCSVLCDTLMVDVCHYIFVKIHRMNDNTNGSEHDCWTLGGDVSI